MPQKVSQSFSSPPAAERPAGADVSARGAAALGAATAARDVGRGCVKAVGTGLRAATGAGRRGGSGGLTGALPGALLKPRSSSFIILALRSAVDLPPKIVAIRRLPPRSAEAVRLKPAATV